MREHVDRGEKVLIHCQHGIGRSPLLALCVLVDHGLEPLDALTLAKDRRAAVSPSRSQYEGWANWLRRRGKDAPDYHSFGASRTATWRTANGAPCLSTAIIHEKADPRDRLEADRRTACARVDLNSRNCPAREACQRSH